MKNRLKRLLRRGILAVADIAILYCCALFASYAVSSNLLIIHSNIIPIFAIILMQVAFLMAFRIYNIRIVDSSLDLAVRGASALLLSSLVILVIVLTQMKDFAFAFRLTSVYVSYTVLFLLGYRIVYRMLFSYHVRVATGNGYPRTLVYGAGEIGLQLARQFYKKKLPYHLVGFVDDDPAKQHSIVGGLTVLGPIDNLTEIVRSSQAEVLILAITDLSSEKMRKSLDVAEKFGIETKIVPSLFEMEQGRKSVADIRSINFDDLLGRSPITFNKTPVQEMVNGKRILVTGAGGSIGSEISRQLLSYQPAQLLLLDIDETELHDLSLQLHKYQAEFSETIMPIVCDVRNATKVSRVFEKYHPEIVFHAAAYKHVPMMEYYPEEAVRTNVGGTYNVLRSAIDYSADKCILVSTDKAVNPTNVMGATKRVAEMVASMLSTRETEIVCVRFGNVLGSRGSMLPLFLEQMRAGLPITVTDKRIIRFFMTIPEAVSLVFLAGALGTGGEVMVLDMGEQVNIYDFAQRLVKYFGDGRSEVIITGLRPGEKLYEEKLSDKDKTIPTDNPKVFKAIVNGTLRREEFEQFIQSVYTMEPQQLVGILRDLVPEFTYQGGVGTGSSL
ncbi:polysaccharide biosynthesis protein [Pleomorphochaeta sp. DL1XJH-081]|uniref:polysaccharide biosynthesis protein n=1 Tax=Pleomorphochaeta sp. DL1XJH-081 TaxID=3409690 RepID=UPI003BB63BF1